MYCVSGSASEIIRIEINGKMIKRLSELTETDK